MSKPNTSRSRALIAGTLLPHNYIIDSVLGEGGFGITYLCTLLHTEQQVAIKEYFPDHIAYRSSEKNCDDVLPYAKKQELYERERRHVLTEAGILLKFQHLDHIVRVKDILEANETIYLVMEYIDGITLKQYVSENGPLPYDELSKLILPVMRDLIQIHKKGLLHRDISPDNLILGTDNQLHLIDFGSAGYNSTSEAEEKTVILKSGFAPQEQYLPSGKLGDWTDIYGICATMYYTLTGMTPTDAISRLQGTELPALSNHAQIRAWQAKVIEKGMQPSIGDRYQTMESLYQSLIIPPIEVSCQTNANTSYSMHSAKTILPSSLSVAPAKTAIPKIQHPKKTQRKKGILLLVAVLVILLIYCGLGVSGVSLPFWSRQWHLAETEQKENPSTKQPDTADSSKKTTTGENTANDIFSTEDATTINTSANNSSKEYSTTEHTTTSATSTKKTTQPGKKKSSENDDQFISLPEDDSYNSFTN